MIVQPCSRIRARQSFESNPKRRKSSAVAFRHVSISLGVHGRRRNSSFCRPLRMSTRSVTFSVSSSVREGANFRRNRPALRFKSWRNRCPSISHSSTRMRTSKQFLRWTLDAINPILIKSCHRNPLATNRESGQSEFMTSLAVMPSEMSVSMLL